MAGEKYFVETDVTNERIENILGLYLTAHPEDIAESVEDPEMARSGVALVAAIMDRKSCKVGMVDDAGHYGELSVKHVKTDDRGMPQSRVEVRTNDPGFVEEITQQLETFRQLDQRLPAGVNLFGDFVVTTEITP